VLTSTLPVLVTSHLLTQGDRSNDKNPAEDTTEVSAKVVAKAVAEREALGRSRGGLTTKIVLAGDSRARPVSRVTTAGHRHDSTAFDAVLAGIRICRTGRGRPRTTPGHLLGDKAFSNKTIRGQCRRRGITATIPEKTDQIRHRAKRGSRGGRPPAFDPERYKQRNTAERCINKLKGFRAVATRYDKRDFMYQATIDVASIRIWLRDPVP
jgi:transposase